MSLSVTTLKAEFLKLMDPTNPGFVTHPMTTAAAASNWADAYDAYALNAQDISGDALVTANKVGFRSTLAAYLPDGSVGTPATGAEAFAKAFVVYWTWAAFSTFVVPAPPNDPPTPPAVNTGIFSVEATSVVISVDSTALENLLLAEFSSLVGTVDAKAESLANAFHAATTQNVVILIAGLDTTLPSPLPITNTNFIY